MFKYNGISLKKIKVKNYISKIVIYQINISIKNLEPFFIFSDNLYLCRRLLEFYL
jgi:hypothetical protein